MYTWAVSVGTGTVLSEMGEYNDSVVVQFSGAGPWQLEVYQEIEITTGGYCQSLTQTIDVYPFSPPVISGTYTICADAVETYTAGLSNSLDDVEWFISPSGQGTIQSGQGTNMVSIKWHGPSNTATLTVTTCTGSDSQTITINGPPDPVASYDMLPVFCLGDAVTLTLSTSNVGGYSYQWYKDGLMVPSANTNTLPISIASFGSTGTYEYYVEVIDNGCIVISNIIDVIINNCDAGTPGGPPGPAGYDVVAFFWAYVECDQVTLIDQSYTVGTGVITSYTWTVTGPGTGTFSPNANDPNPVLTVTASGFYNVTLVITSSTGCSSTYAKTVEILLPTATIASTSPACENSPIYFTATPYNAAWFYEWDFGDGYTSYEANTEHSYDVASPPVYTVNLVIKDEKGCVATATTTIFVNEVTNCTISATDTIFCPGGFETLAACDSMSSYQWYKDDNPISGANSLNYNVYEHGEYWVEVVNNRGCVSTSNHIYMYMHSLPVAKLSGEGHICAFPGSTSGVYLTANYDSDYAYSWSSNPPGASFSPATGSSTWASVTLPAILPAAYEFMVDVTDLTTGCVNSDTICVFFYEQPTLSLPFLSACEGDAVLLTPTPNDPTKYAYQWNNGETTPTIVASNPGHYSLTITDLVNGCSAWAEAGFIFEKPDLSLFPLGCADICPPDTLSLYLPLPLNNVQWPYNTYADAYPNISWYDNGDYSSAVGSGETFDFVAGVTGNHEFSVVVQNNFGCVDTAGVFCLTDDVCCDIIVEWQATVDATCPQSADGSFIILLDPSSVGGPFTLTKFWPLPVQSWVITPGVPFTVPGLASGSYGFSISNVDGECEEFFDISIGYLQEDCCFAAIDSSFIHITSPITYTSDMVWDNKYYIADGVMVTVDGAMLDITNVDVVFSECAGIEFINGAYLRANNSVLRPCDIDKTWNGLRFDSPGEFDNIINETTFKNAEVALYFTGQSDGVVSNGLFSNCNYGIRVEDNTDFNHPISGNRFVTEQFFPDWACDSAYVFVNNNSTYGIYSTGSRFTGQVSHNEFINSKGTDWPATYGVYQLSGGGVFSENTFTDLGTSVYLQAQQYYSSVENNEIEVNLQTLGNFTSIYVVSCQGPVIEIVNNELTNNYMQVISFSAIYTYASTNLSIMGNDIEGFNYGIIDVSSINHQISNNTITNAQSYGIYVYELPESLGYITCNVIKMKDFNTSYGLVGYNLSSMTEVSSNCISDCYTSMNFYGWSWTGNSPVLPLIRNNFLYNYNYVGINVQGYSGNIGTINDPGLNTLWSNNNLATDINSNSNITVADNFGMFNISFPQVQITSNNPYHSTASCAQQIFNMPSQGNLNINYDCDNSRQILDPLMGAGGQYSLSTEYRELLKSSITPFEDVSMILTSLEEIDMELLDELIELTYLSENQKALLKYNFFYRNGDYSTARMNLEMFVPENIDQENFITLAMYEMDVKENGWEVLRADDIEILTGIMYQKSVYSNMAISLLNNVSGYEDYLLEEPLVANVIKSDNIQHIDDNSTYLNIYPNPVSSSAFVEIINNSGEYGQVAIYDMRGKLITEYNINFVAGGIELDIRQLKAGVYFVAITDAESGLLETEKW